MELGIKLSFKDQVGRFLKVLDLIGISPNLTGGFSGIYPKLFLETFDVKRKKLLTFWTIFYISYENDIKIF